MAEIADFQIFWDNAKFTLNEQNTSKNISCPLPANISPLAGGIVAFNVSDVGATSLGGGTPTATLELSCNSKVVATYILKPGVACGLVAQIHKDTGGTAILKAGSNTLKFKLIDPLDTITVTAPALWFQRNV